MTPDEFWQILHAPAPGCQIFYRLYYDDNGNPLTYTMEDLPGNFVEIDSQTYLKAPRNIKVVDGRIRYIDTPLSSSKIKPSADIGTACDPTDVCIVVDTTRPHRFWKKS